MAKKTCNILIVILLAFAVEARAGAFCGPLLADLQKVYVVKDTINPNHQACQKEEHCHSRTQQACHF